MLASPQLPSKNKVSLRLASSAGEALPAELGEHFSTHFSIDIIDGIGSTEMLHIYLSNRPGQVNFGTSGWPVSGYELVLRDESGAEVNLGEIGELYVKGPSSAVMYWDKPQKTKETFLGDWVKSGDKYTQNSDQSYTYSGRSDDMLKVSGMYVSPFEVENTIAKHPSVLESAVIAKIDHQGLTKTKAFVVLIEGCQLTKEELKEYVKSQLAPYKYPRIIEFVEELPKTATGKIQRYKLRQQESEPST
jgi:benzoate-CoA ligase